MIVLPANEIRSWRIENCISRLTIRLAGLVITVTKGNGSLLPFARSVAATFQVAMAVRSTAEKARMRRGSAAPWRPEGRRYPSRQCRSKVRHLPQEVIDCLRRNSSMSTMRTPLSAKGQVTIPEAIRRRLGLRPGTILEFRAEGGRLIGIKATAEDVFRKWRGRGRLQGGIGVNEYLRCVRGPGAHGD